MKRAARAAFVVRSLVLTSLVSVIWTGQVYAFARANWVPREGTSYVRADSVGRYAQEYFTWASSSQLSDLQGANVTLEVETHLNCSDSTCYAKVIKNAPRPLRGTSWDTNMPDGYLDTRFLDDPNFPNWTVGSSDTRGMRAGVWYDEWIRYSTGYGETATDTGSVSFQRGHRDPSWCGDPFCVYPDDTVYVIPNWQLVIPAAKTWYWP